MNEAIAVGALTDVGMRRATNQDAFLAERGVYVVCDGMGGESGGERASAIAVEEFTRLAADGERTRAAIDAAVQRAQRRARALGVELGGIAGTTISGIVLPQWGAGAATSPLAAPHGAHAAAHMPHRGAESVIDDWDATLPGATLDDSTLTGEWLAARGGRDETRPSQAEKPTKPKLEKPNPQPRPSAKQAVTNAPAPKTVEAKVPKPATNAPPPFVKRPGALQLPDGKVLTFPAPREGEIRKVYAYGHMYECDHEGNFRDVTKRQLFKTAFEANFLGLANADKPFIPVFLKGLENAEVQKILLKPYELKGDETEEEMAQLKAYDDMRAAALQFMDEGGSFDEFVDYFAQQVKQERETNALCLREVMTLYKQGKFDEAKDMAEAANALKKQKGLKELKLPAHVRERLGL